MHGPVACLGFREKMEGAAGVCTPCSIIANHAMPVPVTGTALSAPVSLTGQGLLSSALTERTSLSKTLDSDFLALNPEQPLERSLAKFLSL